MRTDLNKLLCERERRGSSNSFGNNRHDKAFITTIDEDGESQLGGLNEGIKTRFTRNWREGKDFGENFRPLYGLCDKSVGRKWDDFYSDLCKVFDMSLVVNDHIMVHLDSYIQRDIKVDENGNLIEYWYRGSRSFNPKTYVGLYVDPRDGIIKAGRGNNRSNRDRKKQEQLKKEAEKASVFRDLGDGTVLRNIDGTWFQFDIKEVPVSVITYTQPPGVERFADYGGRMIGWDRLSDAQKARYGVMHRKGGGGFDEFTRTTVYTQDFYGRNPAKYHANKRTASSDVLRKAGL